MVVIGYTMVKIHDKRDSARHVVCILTVFTLTWQSPCASLIGSPVSWFTLMMAIGYTFGKIRDTKPIAPGVPSVFAAITNEKGQYKRLFFFFLYYGTGVWPT